MFSNCIQQTLQVDMELDTENVGQKRRCQQHRPRWPWLFWSLTQCALVAFLCWRICSLLASMDDFATDFSSLVVPACRLRTSCPACRQRARTSRLRSAGNDMTEKGYGVAALQIRSWYQNPFSTPWNSAMSALSRTYQIHHISYWGEGII